ncbi:hypothetical protein FDUTEX481_07532 [Tolypothrix sp. PCC 7601]|nr:hypothetical protein FDUTEX481_07532 [Tolypothrix sp. PCC 7601]
MKFALLWAAKSYLSVESFKFLSKIAPFNSTFVSLKRLIVKILQRKIHY